MMAEAAIEATEVEVEAADVETVSNSGKWIVTAVICWNG
jgi:hypothetical protein